MVNTLHEKVLNILLIAPLPPPYGGISNWVIMLKKRLAKYNKVSLLGVVDISPSQKSIDKRTFWDRVIVQGFLMLKTRKLLRLEIRDKKPDVIHMTTSGQLAIIRDIMLLKTAKSMNIPTVYHIRFGRIPEISSRNTKEWKLIKKAISLATNAIAIDSSTYSVLCDYFDESSISYVPNPFDTEDIAEIKKVMPESNSNKGRKIMFLGWCLKTKGIEELLAAWSSICKKYPTWKLEIVGPCSNDYRNYLLNNFSFEQVDLVGEKIHKEALKALFDSDVFILPSYTEGFPNVILEAMALEKPIIATDTGAIKDMLNNECGIIIKPQSISEIESSLSKLLDNEELRRKLGKNAESKLQAEYLVDKIIGRYIDIWQKSADYNKKILRRCNCYDRDFHSL